MARKTLRPVGKIVNISELQNAARIFISCGQQEITGEREIANQISKKLIEMGFEVYVATQEQSLKGIKENIFSRLEESEYLIFIDFNREQLISGEHRGSLFSHQELAIATYLDKEILAFQEEGIKKMDGILGFVQANPIYFVDRELLLGQVLNKVKERGWKPDWRNEIVLDADDSTFDAISYMNQPSRWYYVKAKNLHQQKMAYDCVAYLISIKNLLSGQELPPLHIVEFKWESITVPRIVIPPGMERRFDAFFVSKNTPNVVFFGINHTLIDNSPAIQEYVITGPGAFEIKYTVFSVNFSPTTSTFILNIGSKLDELEFYKRK